MNSCTDHLSSWAFPAITNGAAESLHLECSRPTLVLPCGRGLCPLATCLGCDWDFLTLQLAQAHDTGELRTSGPASGSPGPARVHRGFHAGFLPLYSRPFSAWLQSAPKALPCSGPCSFHLTHESHSMLFFPTWNSPSSMFYQDQLLLTLHCPVMQESSSRKLP